MKPGDFLRLIDGPFSVRKVPTWTRQFNEVVFHHPDTLGIIVCIEKPHAVINSYVRVLTQFGPAYILFRDVVVDPTMTYLSPCDLPLDSSDE